MERNRKFECESFYCPPPPQKKSVTLIKSGYNMNQRESATRLVRTSTRFFATFWSSEDCHVSGMISSWAKLIMPPSCASRRALVSVAMDMGVGAGGNVM
jgi:hypothetical protein